MPFKILYVTATRAEAEALSGIKGMNPFPGGFLYGNIEINLLVAGVGAVTTAWSVKQWLASNNRPDLAINAGIAGSYNDDINIGAVVMPGSDCFADSGIEDGENFLTLYEAGISKEDEFPFRGGVIDADAIWCEKMKGILKPVRAITVNTATGSEHTRNKLIKKFNPDIETMEGATFFYICCLERIPFLALRAISNKVELRNRGNWNIPLALNNLSEKLIDVLLTLK
jgi:futalosine hydrolase